MRQVFSECLPELNIGNGRRDCGPELVKVWECGQMNSIEFKLMGVATSDAAVVGDEFQTL